MMQVVSSLLGAVGLTLALWALSWAFTLPGLREAGLPPGPKALPIIGSLHKIPRTGIHLQFTKWARIYGPIVSLKIGHGTMVVLSSAKYAVQLLDKRSARYSNRPPSYVVGKLVFHDDHPMFMNADERWKLRRKLYYGLLRESRCNAEHVALVEAEASQLVRDFCIDPEALMLHPGRFSNSIIMSLVFGIRTPRYDTPHYLALQSIMTELSALGEVGATPPVDLLSILRYVPERLWGNWRTRAAGLHQKLHALHAPLIDRVLERRRTSADKTAPASRATFLDDVLDAQETLQLTRSELEIMCGNLLEGGTDTMATTILTLCQAMANNPSIQAAAHDHVDSVLDATRSPTWSDYAKLPYISMIIKELLRWRPPAPSAFPHATASPDTVDEMRIPAGATVMVNIWGIHHDASRYPSPETFDPSRFEGQTAPAPVYANAADPDTRDHFAYGAGRRICPGIHLAERALFVAVAKMLWAFDFEPKDGQKVNVDPATAYRDGFLNQCRPFEVVVRVRSEERRRVLMAEAAVAEEVFKKYT
ncbi:hypothetical protein BDW72DRAFT_207473 [Aspergillus terricola var. indicus]